MRHPRAALTAAVLALSCAMFTALPAALAEDAVVAKINGKEIRESDLLLAAAEVGPEIASIPPENRRRLLLEFLIEMRIFADAAEGEQLTKGADFEQRLAYWTTRAKRDAYYDRAVKGGVGEEAVRGFYDDKVKEIPPEEEVVASHILVESEAEAQALADKAGKGEDFGKLAEEHSRDPGSKGNRGQLGAFSRGQMVKEFEDAAFALEKGQVSKPVKSQFGWHVIKLEDRRTKLPPSFDEVRDQIVNAMVQQKGQEVAKELREKAKIEYVDTAIREQVEKETAAETARQQMFDQEMDEQIQKMEDAKQLEKEQK